MYDPKQYKERGLIDRIRVNPFSNIIAGHHQGGTSVLVGGGCLFNVLFVDFSITFIVFDVIADSYLKNRKFNAFRIV